MELIQMLKALGDETRVRIMNLLQMSELCVGELEHLLCVNQSNMSRHLTTLKNAKLITFEKKAQWIYYKLDNKTLDEHPFIKELLGNELKNIEKFIKDVEKFDCYKKSGQTCEDLKECKNGC